MPCNCTQSQTCSVNSTSRTNFKWWQDFNSKYVPKISKTSNTIFLLIKVKFYMSVFLRVQLFDIFYFIMTKKSSTYPLFTNSSFWLVNTLVLYEAVMVMNTWGALEEINIYWKCLYWASVTFQICRQIDNRHCSLFETWCWKLSMQSVTIYTIDTTGTRRCTFNV